MYYSWLKQFRKLKPEVLEHIRQNFMASGMVDWHIQDTVISAQAIELNEQDDDGEHEIDVMIAPPQLQRPPQYVVVLLNDDYTPMDFVIEILQQYFALDLDRATQVMLTVHHEGKGIAGIYPRDIAETKANQVNNYARSQGHPLLCQIEPQE